MGAASLTCDRCRTRLPVTALNTPHMAVCPGCNNSIWFFVFPAYYRAHAPAKAGETLMVEGESSCFYHPTKKAVVPCDGCGRFLCALCDVELDAKHLCPKCVEAAKEKKTMNTLENERFLYDAVALLLALLGLLLLPCAPYVSVFMAPTAIYLSIRHWNAPRSLMSRTKWRFVVAIFLALIDLAFLISIVGIFIVGIYSAS